ncbi:hypothetical protein ACI6PS_06965 [Flavobacterium sp. PLA-1-15]|uniref:hypothetical protein n=1 Tax=Flavobacterium sp. PLA-1-15 TaxID=3380533 RepID=UPI003B7EA806
MNRIVDLTEVQLKFIKNLIKVDSLIRKAVDDLEIKIILEKVYREFKNVEPPKFRRANNFFQIDNKGKFLLLDLFRIEMDLIYSSLQKRKVSVILTLHLIIGMFLLYDDELNKLYTIETAVI